MRRILCLALAVLCLGCTKLVSYKVMNSSNTGLVYSLKKVGYVGNMTHVISCENGPKVDILIDLIPMYTKDKTAEFVVNYDKWFKINKQFDLNMVYDDYGALKSINAQAEDKSIEIATKILSTAASIAAKAAIFRTGGACEQSIKTAFDGRNQDKETLKEHSAKYKYNNNVISDKEKMLQNTRLNKNDYEGTLNEIRALTDENKKLSKNIEEIQEKIQANENLLKVVQGVSLGIMNENREEVWAPDPQVIKMWFPSDAQNKTNELTVFASLSNFTVPHGKPENCTDGIYYRLPAPGLLAVCTKEHCRNGRPVDKGKLLYAKFVEVPQFGDLAILPFHNNVGISNNINVAFNPNGGLQSARIINSPGDKKIGEMLDQLSASFQTVSGAIKDKDVSQLNSQTAILKAKIDKIKAEKDLRDAEEALKNAGN